MTESAHAPSATKGLCHGAEKVILIDSHQLLPALCRDRIAQQHQRHVARLEGATDQVTADLFEGYLDSLGSKASTAARKVLSLVLKRL